MDSDSCVQTRVMDGEEKDSIIIERSQDIAPILDRNKAMQLHDDGYSASREWRRAASIPMVVIEQWMKEGVNVFDQNSMPEIRKRLNSSDWRYLRTAEGRL